MTHEYIGTKIVTAWPQEKDGAPGYAVKYADGYVSWSPKDVFDAAYVDIGNVSHLPAHQQRVIGEKAQLDDKIDKLGAFIGSDWYKSLDTEERERLVVQRGAMREYAKILAKRIAAF
jgi:hypothetical protein